MGNLKKAFSTVPVYLTLEKSSLLAKTLLDICEQYITNQSDSELEHDDIAATNSSEFEEEGLTVSIRRTSSDLGYESKSDDPHPRHD